MDLAQRKPHRPPTHRADSVPVGVEMLLHTLNMPAFVVNRYRDVLAANSLAVALSPLMRPGTNRLVVLFTDPLVRVFHPDLDDSAADVVAQLRAERGSPAADGLTLLATLTAGEDTSPAHHRTELP